MKIKNIARLLLIVLAFGLMPVSVSAESENAQDSRAVRLLTTLNIIELDSSTGKFWEETPVRRSEMAKILCRLFSAEVQTQGQPVFKDVSEDDRAYVETAVRNGYMSGYGDGNFGADEFITNEQLIKIFVSFLGGDALAGINGGYPAGYIYMAKKLKISGNIHGAMTDSARRIDVANVIYDALHSDMIVVNGVISDGISFVRVNGETLLTETLNIYKYEGILEKTESGSIDGSGRTDEGFVILDGELYRDDYDLTDDMIGYDSVIYVKKENESEIGNIIYAEESVRNEVITVSTEDFIADSAGDNNSVSYYEGSKKRTLKLSDVADMLYNGDAVSFDWSKLKNIESGYIDFIDNTGDRIFDVVRITEYDIAVVKKSDTDKEMLIFDYNGGSLSLRNIVYRLKRNGETEKIENVGIGEVALIAVTEDKAFYSIELSDICVSGTVSKLRVKDGRTYVSLKDEEYPLSRFCEKLIKSGELSTLASGLAGNFYIAANGEVAYFGLNKSKMKVGYIVAASINDDEPFNKTMNLRMFTEDGELTVYEIGEKLKIDEKSITAENLLANPAMVTKISTPQLVKYKEADGKIKEIEFALNGYDEKYFSMDLDASTSATKISLTSKNVLDNKYYVTSGTKVFSVSGTPGDDDPAHYKIDTGSYFAKVGESYATLLYDIEENGFVRYALRYKWWSLSGCWSGSPIILVESVADGVDENGDETSIIEGYNESGRFVSVVFEEPSATEGIEAGDIIQYANNFAAKPHGIDVLHKNNSAMYGPKKADYDKYAFGEVVRCTPDSMQISSSETRSPSMPPTAIDLFVLDSGCPVYIYNRENATCTLSSYDSIAPGDNVFAYVDEDNKTRMMVVYE